MADTDPTAEAWEASAGEVEEEVSEERHKEWIRAYMEQQAEEEERARRAAKVGIRVVMDWSSWKSCAQLV